MATYKVQVDSYGYKGAIIFGTPVLRTAYLTLEYFAPRDETRLSMALYYLTLKLSA